MNKQLEGFLKRGSDWLKDMIKDGLTEYEKALKLLLEKQKAIKSKNAEKDTKKKKTPQDKRTTARNKAIKAIDDKENNLATATTAMNKAKSDFQAAEDIIHKITDNEKKDAEKINQRYEAKKTALTKAKGKLTTAKKQMGKAERELVKYHDTLLILETEGLQREIVYLQAFEKARLGLEMPKAELICEMDC